MPRTNPEIFESFSSVMELLRDSRFQDLLENYERAKKVFMVGYEVEDEVKSMVLFEAEGKYGLNAEDYLVAFSEFIKQKEKEIDAISILLNRPKNWNTKALNELRIKLKENSYPEPNLQAAHRLVYHKDMIDIISMVKHAASEKEPLLNPSERVDNAISKVIEGKNLNPEQEQWMGYIKEHLKHNLTLDEDDLKEVPVFTDHGGLSRFKKVFRENHKMIINEINTAVAA